MRKTLKNVFEFLYSKPELLFVLIALPFGLFSAIFVPQISVTDENAHVLRIYQISQGEVVCHGKYDYPRDIVDKSLTSQNRAYTADFSDEIEFEETKQHSCGSAASYFPIAYIPHVVGAWIAQLLHPTAASVVLLARIGSLLFYLFAVYIIIKKVRVGKYVFFVIALIPQMIHLAASLSADMMNNVATLAIIALTLNLFVQSSPITKRQVFALMGLMMSAALLKLTIIIILIPLIFLPLRLFRKNRKKGPPFNIQKWSLAGVSAILAGGIYVIWSKASFFSRPEVEGLYNPIPDQPNLFINLLFNTYLSDYGDLVLRGVFGEFSSFLYHFPTILVILQIFILMLVLLYNPHEGDRRISQNGRLVVSMTLAFILSVLVITYGMYTEWGLKRGISEYADGVQGRYFTALLVLLIPLFAWISRYVSIRVKSDRLMLWIISIGQIILLSFYVLYTIKTLLGK